MSIETRFTVDDANLINSERLSAARARNQPLDALLVNTARLIRFVEAALREMGVGEAVVDMLRHADGSPYFGSGRIPFVVHSEEQPFIIKRYDSITSAAEERRVLRRVSGVIAPQVLYLGKRFYAEQLVSAKGLDDLFEESPEQAVRIGGIGHAELAQLRVNYNHEHWLDEFRWDGEKLRILDFGTAYIFADSEEEVRSRGVLEMVQYQGLKPTTKRLFSKLDEKGIDRLSNDVMIVTNGPSMVAQGSHMVAEMLVMLINAADGIACQANDYTGIVSQPGSVATELLLQFSAAFVQRYMTLQKGS